MGKCNDYKQRSESGLVVLVNDKLQLKINSKSFEYCNCHPETCTHFDNKRLTVSEEYFDILNTENTFVGDSRKYKFIGRGNNQGNAVELV